MAESILDDYPELRPFFLSTTAPTGTRIGAGAYGSVEEVAVPGAICAAKKIHDFFLDATQVPPTAIRSVSVRFVRECQLMSTLRHPHIVQFLGICFLPGSRLPALVMERLATNLHDLLDPETIHPSPKPLFPLSLKYSVLHDVASGLAFLHERSPPVIHRDLSARNVLLNSGMVAKIADLGVARIVPRMGAAATMTKAPGASVYMPPEALENRPGYGDDMQSKYDAGIDVFSYGVVVIFMLSQTFPCDLLAPNYREGGRLLGRTELERREMYMRIIRGQLCKMHPLLQLIESCLDFPECRPNIQQVLNLLEQAKALIGGEDETDASVPMLGKVLQQLQGQQGLQLEMDQHLAQARQQLSEKEEQLRSCESEKQRVSQQLIRREMELTQAEETIRRDQQVIQEMTEREAQLLEEKERLQQQLRQREEQLESISAIVAGLRPQLTQPFDPHKCHVSGPGLGSATANHSTHVVVELSDCISCPAHYVTAQLKQNSGATAPVNISKWPWSKKSQSHTKQEVLVLEKSHSRYEVSYKAVCRGCHKLHIQVNGKEIDGSPFVVQVYPDPMQLDSPKRIITNLNGPYGISLNNHGEMIVSERDEHKISIFNTEGQICQTFGSHSDSTDQMKSPKGVAVDDEDNIYVSSMHKLQKFTRNGKLLKCVVLGSRKLGAIEPCGIAIYNNKLYTCDKNNHCIHVFELDLGYYKSIASHGRGRGELNTPLDIKFDAEGTMYVAEFGNKRVQVMDTSGHFIRAFGDQSAGKMCGPSGLHIAGNYVYVSDFVSHCVLVYETSGKFVTSLGKFGWKSGQFRYPCCITSCVDGFIHVCDSFNGRVQIF